MKPRTGRNSFGSPADRMACCPVEEDDRRGKRTKSSGGCQDICTNMGNWILPSHTRPLLLLLVGDGMWKSCSHTHKKWSQIKNANDHFPYYDVHVICRPGLYRYVMCYNRLCLGTCYPSSLSLWELQSFLRTQIKSNHSVRWYVLLPVLFIFCPHYHHPLQQFRSGCSNSSVTEYLFWY